jgi:hypothetical protein
VSPSAAAGKRGQREGLCVGYIEKIPRLSMFRGSGIPVPMSNPQPIRDCDSLDDLTHLIVRGDAPRVGIVADPSLHLSLIEALSARLANANWHTVGLPLDLQGDDLSTHLATILPYSPFAPAQVRATSEAWRDDLSIELRREQVAAQERIAAAKQQGAAVDPFDRDVAGWLAAGLCDLFADKFTGESFLKGAFARLATDSSAIFVEADFLRPDGIRFMEAGRPAQSMLTKLSLASTTQFRAAAVRLVNQLKNRLKSTVREMHHKRVVFVGTNEAQLRELLTDDAPFFRYIEQPAVVPSVFAGERERILTNLKRTNEQLRLFVKRRLFVIDGADLERNLVDAENKLAVSPIDEDAERQSLDNAHAELVSAQQSLQIVWQRWFAEQLAGIDAEWFLRQDPDWDFLDVPQYMDGVRDILLRTEDTAIKLPANEDDFAAAEKFIAALRELDRRWRSQLLSPVEDGMAFDAAVAAGGAPLDLFTKDIEWWLKTENKDWSKYRIVRVD